MKQYFLFSASFSIVILLGHHNIGCSTAYHKVSDQETAKKLIPRYKNLADEINKSDFDIALEKFLYSKSFFKENEKVLLFALEMFESNPSIKNEQIIKKLLRHGANFCRISPNDFPQETMQKFDLAWKPVLQDKAWQENHSHLPSYILKRFRCGKNYEQNDTPKNRLVFCLVHGTGDGLGYTTFYMDWDTQLFMMQTNEISEVFCNMPRDI